MYISTLSQFDYTGILNFEETVTETLQVTNSLTSAFSACFSSSTSLGVKQSFGIEAKAGFGESSITAKYSNEISVSNTISVSATKSTSNTETTATTYSTNRKCVYDLVGTSAPSGMYRYALYATCDVYFIIQTTKGENKTLIEMDVIICARSNDLFIRAEYSSNGHFSNDPKSTVDFPEDFYKNYEDSENETPETGFPVDTSKIQIVAGWSHSLMLDTKGHIYAWGLNDNYQLGDGTKTNRNTPTPISVSENIKFKQIAAGYKHSLAIDNDGNIWAWGLNDYGQLGNGSKTTPNTPPTKINTGETRFKQIAAGYKHSLAIDTNGDLYVWGLNDYYQLGNNNTTTQTIPLKINTFAPGFSKVAGGYSHSLAVDTEGNLWAWGRNSDGQIGDNSTTTAKTPTQLTVSIPNIRFAEINCIYQSLAIDTKGNLWVWGAGDDYRIGFGTTADKKIPTIVPQVGACKSIVAGRYHTLVVDVNGEIWAAGSGSNGKLGIGSSDSYKEFTRITDSKSSKDAIGGNLFVSVTAGEQHSMAIGADGSLWSWGSGANGQLGHGNTASSSTPKRNEIATYILQNAYIKGVYLKPCKWNNLLNDWP